ERGWEYKHICVTRVPGYGFGIAVSGGRDNPHFASGDPSIAVSDVLASGPAERLLQVNDRIISVNNISLQNVDYATAVQVLRDSGDTVTLVVKRRAPHAHHSHSHSHSASFNGPSLPSLAAGSVPTKVTLTKNSKKEDFGIVLGCKLFIKEISPRARDQLLNTNQSLEIGDLLTKLNNTNCNDVMSLKEAKKIIDGSKDKLQITVAREVAFNSNVSHQAQSSISTTGAVNNFYKGDEFLTSGHTSYSNQNLYVQPPTRPAPSANAAPALSGGFEDAADRAGGPSSLPDEKSNLAPRGGGRSGQPEHRNSVAGGYGTGKGREEPPRPPPPRAEDYYSSRRQIYEDDPIIQKTNQPIPDARFITFHKEGSVGIRLTGGNHVGIFVTAVQPGSPASLQGLQPGDKILKVNDMDMTGVTREEAVLFLLSLQDRIELIVQFCKEEYDNIVASQKGDSFYVKTHFHYESPAKGEMSFRSGDTFHVIDTLYNGVVGCWQVFRIGRNNQEVQKGIIPNKSRAEELATAQFNATKKEMSANESRGSFFKRRRSSNRRSKSLGKEHWDDILFSDTVSKFPAYERVLLKHPGFTRPVILFGPIADVAREKLLKDYPDKFISPQLDVTAEESNSKSNKTSSNSNIIRLSAIRDVIATGKHALLDITPNAVERLNYAQMYPIVVFFKAETKIVVKQLRQGLPKSAHKSSKKLLEQCQKLDKVWSHVFSAMITLNDNTDTWYRKVREIIDKQQSGALWMSESKPEESLSDDFLFPMSSLRLSYASSPESDLEHSPGPPNSPGVSGSSGGVGRLAKASSDPSVVMPDSSTTDVLPPYQPTYDTRYGFNQDQQPTPTDPNLTPTDSPLTKEAPYALSSPDIPSSVEPQSPYDKMPQSPYDKMPQSPYDKMPQSPYDKMPQSPYDKIPIYGDKNQIYSSDAYQKPDYPKMGDQRHDFDGRRGEFGSPERRHNEFGSAERRNEYNGDKNLQHKRQASTLHGNYHHAKAQPGPDQAAPKEGVYGQVPDLPPRVDRAAKPAGILATPNKVPNGRSAHERLFGTKGPSQGESHEAGGQDGGNFSSKPGSLDRSQNSKSDSLSSYDSFNKQSAGPTRIGPNAHDDLKTTLSKIDPTTARPQNGVPKYGWKADKYGHADSSPRHSRESDKEGGQTEAVSPRGSVERDSRDMYRSPNKQHIPGKSHIETKTDYGKYSSSRNNSHPHQQPPSQPPDYARTISSHQDLRESTLSIHQQQSPMRSPPMHHRNGYDGNNGGGPPNHLSGPPNHLSGGGQANGHGYKPVPPPKPKNYKPPYKGYGGGGEQMVQATPIYQHGKSHSNPVDQRHQNMNLSSPQHHNYYYNAPPPNHSYHADPASRYPSGGHYPQGGHYDVSPPGYQGRHPSISYASRSEITPLGGHPHHQQQHDGGYGVMGDLGEGMETRGQVVDLQGSREQRGSAFELYRKPVGHNMRGMVEQPAFYGSQPNLAQKLNTSSATNSPKITPKLTKTQSFKHQKSEGFTPKLFRKLSFTRKNRESTPKMNKKLSLQPEINENSVLRDINRNAHGMQGAQERDITAATVTHKGATLVNQYWGVSLEIPYGAIPKREERHIYFVISDPRLCENAPPLDLDNGETMLSPLVMCGPQGTEFLKPVILNIPHYANTLPSLGISLKATDSEQDIQTDWDNILLPSNHAANSVAVKVDHF
ncbi:unnamed protein product, partial [Phaedon cochleariae]